MAKVLFRYFNTEPLSIKIQNQYFSWQTLDVSTETEPLKFAIGTSPDLFRRRRHVPIVEFEVDVTIAIIKTSITKNIVYKQ